MQSEPASIIVALISIIGLSAAAAVTGAWGWRAQKSKNKLAEEIEILKSNLAEEKSEKDAWRAYKHKALEHLYERFEPQSFQLIELSEIAIRRIRGFGRETNDRRGLKSNEKSHLSDINSYTMANAIYRLLAPLAAFRLMQRSLTFTDLLLDQSVNYRYKLAKVLYYSFTHDSRLAKSHPSRDYDPRRPFHPSWIQKDEEKENSKKYVEQGIYYQSRVDTMADALIDNSESKPKIITFNDFQLRYCNGTLLEPFDIMGKLLLNFHPETKPVLWRILILQMYIYKAIKNIHLDREKAKDIRFYGEESLDNAIANVRFSGEELEDLNWDSIESQEHIKAVEKYLRDNWKELRK
ncbi:MAG TPA: hypothetical protein VFY68_16935 [Nitrososphaeraceae archaeon]|nr:hypothetical protein [Nitrososphaeraceae archaeon]